MRVISALLVAYFFGVVFCFGVMLGWKLAMRRVGLQLQEMKEDG